MIVGIHQPNYLPYLGFFEKFFRSDVYVILDHVQYTKNGFQNRNQINTKNGPVWLTIPVKHKLGMKTNEILVDNGQKWKKQHFTSILQNYAKAKYFADCIVLLENIYSGDWEKLVDINSAILKVAFSLLDPGKKIIHSSEMSLNSNGSGLILEICKKTNASSYLSGKSGRSYLYLQEFEENNIEVVFQEYNHPVYDQVHGSFRANLAFIDYIFNCGTESFIKLFK